MVGTSAHERVTEASAARLVVLCRFTPRCRPSLGSPALPLPIVAASAEGSFGDVPRGRSRVWQCVSWPQGDGQCQSCPSPPSDAGELAGSDFTLGQLEQGPGFCHLDRPGDGEGCPGSRCLNGLQRAAQAAGGRPMSSGAQPVSVVLNPPVASWAFPWRPPEFRPEAAAFGVTGRCGSRPALARLKCWGCFAVSLEVLLSRGPESLAVPRLRSALGAPLSSW